MKILIAVPTFESIYPDTFKSIYELETGEHEVIFDFVRGYDVATARNNIARLAIELETDYVLMVDNDIVLPKDALLNLIDGEKDVCLGYYAHRDKKDNIYRRTTCICRLEDDDGCLYFGYPADSQYRATDLLNSMDNGLYKIKVHGGGMGCALIKTSTFEKFAHPWFAWMNYPGTTINLSEDLYFCDMCHKAGTDIWVDSRVSCGHILRQIQWPV